MSLEQLWFFLWGLLWAIYFVTDGFDLGVAMLLPFAGKGESDKRMLYNAIGPLWDGNEVWLVTAGGVTFAAFPKTYAAMFSSLYTALTLLLVALIIRGVALEYRSKTDSPAWKKVCDWCLFAGSGLTALLIGVAFANIFRGIPLENGVFKGSFLGLLNPYAVFGGVFFISIFLLHGAVWLAVKTSGQLYEKAKKLTGVLWVWVLVITVGFLVYTYLETGLYANYLSFPVLFIVPLMAVAALALCRIYLSKDAMWKAWFTSAAFIISCTFFCIIGLFPNMLPSTIDPDVNTINCYDAASSPLTLKVMLAVVLMFIPMVLAYQVWAYMLFSKKIESGDMVY